MRPCVAPVSRFLLVQARLDLCFPQPIALLLISVQPGAQPHLSGAGIRNTGTTHGLRARFRMYKIFHRNRIDSILHKVLGWVTMPGTFTDRTSVTERTRKYSPRVPGMVNRAKDSIKNPTATSQ